MMLTPTPCPAPATAPRIITDRLTLRGHLVTDLEDCTAMWADPRVYTMISAQPRPREDVWIRLLRSVGQWTLAGYGSWIVRENATGRLIGEMGLIEARRAITPSIDAVPEVGWALAGDAHGQGYASEALAAILAWVDRRMEATVCIIDPANTPSIRLARRFGFVERLTGVYNGKPILIFDRRATSGTASHAQPFQEQNSF